MGRPSGSVVAGSWRTGVPRVSGAGGGGTCAAGVLREAAPQREPVGIGGGARAGVCGGADAGGAGPCSSRIACRCQAVHISGERAVRRANRVAVEALVPPRYRPREWRDDTPSSVNSRFLSACKAARAALSTFGRVIILANVRTLLSQYSYRRRCHGTASSCNTLSTWSRSPSWSVNDPSSGQTSRSSGRPSRC